MDKVEEKNYHLLSGGDCETRRGKQIGLFEVPNGHLPRAKGVQFQALCYSDFQWLRKWGRTSKVRWGGVTSKVGKNGSGVSGATGRQCFKGRIYWLVSKLLIKWVIEGLRMNHLGIWPNKSLVTLTRIWMDCWKWDRERRGGEKLEVMSRDTSPGALM